MTKLHQFDAGRASPSGSAHGQQHPQQQGQARQQQQQQQQLQCQESAVPSEFSELAGMTAEELHLLLVDERAYRWVQCLGSFSVAPRGDHGSLIGTAFIRWWQLLETSSATSCAEAAGFW